ncbi:MAG: polyprenyl synthetase family protein [Neisseriaceae bacterium]|nr:MAG: polyprenyl synthetase family protein [Neisseriaceae bacterium]
MPNLEQWRARTLNEIEQCLDQILTISSSCPYLLEAIRYSTLNGGKRIRPLFTIAAGSLNNANPLNCRLIGCAIEMIHCFSLIHDDLPIMDNDDLRRGKPTNHKVYGDAVALLAGDALHALCFEVLTSDQLAISPERKLRIIGLIAQSIGIEGMVGGQTIDWLSTGKQIDLQQLQQMHTLKTGALLRAAILAGYLAGNEFDSPQYAAIDVIAQKIGLLFQIVDDIIDVTEDTSTLGKTANKDSEQDKATYVNILGLAVAQQTAKNLHSEILELLRKLENSSQLKFLADSVYYRNF